MRGGVPEEASVDRTLASPRGGGQREAAAPPTDPGLYPEIHANPMRRVSAYSGGGETITLKNESHLCGYVFKIQL